LKGKVKPLRETVNGKKATVGEGVVMIDGSSLSGTRAVGGGSSAL
jgi:hypothetical protein